MRETWRRGLFRLYLVGILVLFLHPVPSTPAALPGPWDLVAHFALFFWLVLLYPTRAGRVRIFLVATGLAGGIETVQWLLPYRGAEWLDFLAGMAGSGVGLGFPRPASADKTAP